MTIIDTISAATRAMLGRTDDAVAVQPAVLRGTGTQSIPIPGVGRVLVNRVEPGSVRPFGEQVADASTGSISIGLINDHLHVRGVGFRGV